nr:hypothetical protein Iba_chr15cCG2150 [Ipomoea batatas]
MHTKSTSLQTHPPTPATMPSFLLLLLPGTAFKGLATWCRKRSWLSRWFGAGASQETTLLPCLPTTHSTAIHIKTSILRNYKGRIGTVAAKMWKKGTLTYQMDVKAMVSSLSSNYQLLLVLVQVLDFCCFYRLALSSIRPSRRER